MGNLIAEIGSGQSGASLMLVSNAMNQPQSTMANAYTGEVRDGAAYDLPGEVVLGKGASEQKAVMAAMLAALEALMGRGREATRPAGFPLLPLRRDRQARRHPQRRRGRRACGPTSAIIGGQSLLLSLGNRGPHRRPYHACTASRPTRASAHEGCDAITGAMKLIELLRKDIRLPSHPELGPATLAVNRFRSYPESTHTIPGSGRTHRRPARPAARRRPQ